MSEKRPPLDFQRSVSVLTESSSRQRPTSEDCPAGNELSNTTSDRGKGSRRAGLGLSALALVCLAGCFFTGITGPTFLSPGQSATYTMQWPPNGSCHTGSTFKPYMVADIPADWTFVSAGYTGHGSLSPASGTATVLGACPVTPGAATPAGFQRICLTVPDVKWGSGDSATVSLNVIAGSAPGTFRLQFWALSSICSASSPATYNVTVRQPLTFTHLAGNEGGAGWFDGIGSVARFQSPNGVAADGAGNFYVVDSANHTIRKIVVATGAVTTLAGSPGNAGSADGSGSAVRFNSPNGVAADGAGNVYVADSGNSTIRKIVVATGAVTTLAGTAGSAGNSDGPGSVARFSSPRGVATDGAGNVYVADTSAQTIRRIVVATGAVTTLAGYYGGEGSGDGSGSAARFSNPHAVVADGAGNVYVADSDNHTIRRIIVATGAVTTLAGTAGSAGSNDGSGSVARFSSPRGVAADGAGNVYVADSDNQTIRRIIVATGAVTTLVGFPGSQGSDDGSGSSARFNRPNGVAADGAGNICVADSDNHTIRRIVVATGAVTTLAGFPGSAGSADGSGSSARFNIPCGVASDGAGNVYVADTHNHTIRRVVVATGAVTALAGSPGSFGSDDGSGSSARFDSPCGVAADGAGNVYVADTDNATIRRIVVATGAVTTLAGFPGSFGSADGSGSAAQFSFPRGVAADGAGNVYVADSGNSTVRKIVVATGTVTTLAGSAGSTGTADGSGSSARFYYPPGVAADSAGNVYVADSNNQTIRKIVVATGAVTTSAGLPETSGSADGTGTAARFHAPTGIAADPSGNLFVADSLNHCIRRTVPPLGDIATIDAPSGPVGVLRQLDTSPQTATSWSWQELRKQAGSAAALSSTSIRNPTFTPDAVGSYVFLLTASDGASTSITTISLDAYAAPTATVNGDGALCAGQVGEIQALLVGTAPWWVRWSDGMWQSRVTRSPAVRSVSPSSTTVYTVTALSDPYGPGTSSGAANVVVNPRPDTPYITAPSSVGPGQSFTAFVPDVEGVTYAWVVGNGTVTAGVGTRQITVTAGETGPVTISVTEADAVTACASLDGTVVIPVALLASSYHTVAPCRLFDSRLSDGPAEGAPILAPGETRTLAVGTRCGLSSSTIRSLAINLTVTSPTEEGELILFRGDLGSVPITSSISYQAGKTRANNGIVELPRGGDGTIKVQNRSAGSVHFILDVSGTFE